MRFTGEVLLIRFEIWIFFWSERLAVELDLDRAVPGALALEKRSIGRLVSLFEDSRPEARALRGEALERLRLSGGAGSCAVFLGFTGSPGVGKSTLAGALAKELAERFKVAILAVDPSSDLSGGAFLGDRARTPFAREQSRLYFRSQAAGHMRGGLAPHTFHVCRLFRHLFDMVLVETVGVGQNESAITRFVDRSYLLLQPSSGDHLQFLKAGIMELPDAFVVNKADLPEAERTLHVLRSTLPLARRDGGDVPVFLTCVRDGRGISELAADLAEVRPVADLHERETFFFEAWVREEFGRFGLTKLRELCRTGAEYLTKAGSLEKAMDQFERDCPGT